MPKGGAGLVESTFLAFCLLGVWRLVKSERKDWALALFGSMILLPFLSALAANTPGMRRGIVFLYLFYIFSGSGLALFFELLARVKPVSRTLGYAFSFAALGLSIYWLVHWTKWSAEAVPFSPVSELIQNRNFDDWLQNSNLTVVLDVDGPRAEYTEHFLKAHAYLTEKFLHKRSKNFSVLRPINGYFFPDIETGEKRTMITESKKTLNLFAKDYCVSEVTAIPTTNSTLYSARVTRCPASIPPRPRQRR
jgi:hypothetical protein